MSGGSPAQDAARYIGAGYEFGGIPNTGTGHWDCSSFVNWVFGHDLGYAIPGFQAGKYTGSTHGPVVVDWATWTGASTIKGPPSASDLCIWPGLGALGHIGIAVDGTHMISALNSHYGTIQTPIAGNGPAGVPVVYRRVSGVSGGGSGSSGGMSIPGCIPLIGLVGYALRYEAKRRRLLSRRERRYWRRENEERNETGSETADATSLRTRTRNAAAQ